ncbi:hypothetical protein [Nocardioides lijunqiniae]|uniref:hypothetical protein n=1 Tax=Nocardioides lijunqiniae TaxID=2760832 RepID=UPI0018775536|nr:hypothetical protein [Nocardioides lijunqiniae]
MPTREPFAPGALVRAHPWASGGALVLVVVLAVVTLTGGWSRSAPEGAAQVAPGTEVDAAPFSLRLDEASARFALGVEEAEPGRAFVVVEGAVELTSPTSVTATTLAGALRADLTAYDQAGSPSDDPAPVVRVVPDGSTLLGLGPGLRYDVEIGYVVDEASVPERLSVTVLGHTLRRSALDGELRWFDATPVARLTLDVAPLPPTRPTEDL